MKTITLNLPTRLSRVGFPGTATLAAVAVLGFLFAAPTSVHADPPLPGAIFTTDSTCSGVDLNIYASKDDVYLNGGPPHPGAASLPDGSYYVQVTDPDGSLVLGSSGIATPFVVSGGVVQGCYQLSAIVNSASSGYATAGYDNTDNPGGEYKVWVSNESSFTNNSTKTDNFKVKSGPTPPSTATLCIDKFYDANGNGVKDPGEVSINGWEFLVVADDNLINTRFTPICMVVDLGGFHVFESTPVELNWVHTTQTETDITLNAGDTPTLEFGNVCLGGGNGLTLGFWSNKNGQSLETLADFAFLTNLNLVNATGAAQDFTGSLTADKTALNTWLLNASATNMAYMLSAQLATMELNVRHPNNKYNNNTGVSGSALVYAPNLLQSVNPSFPATAGLTALGFISINDLMTAANNILLPPGNLTTTASTLRSYEQVLKTALDDANNNINFVESSPCPFSFGN